MKLSKKIALFIVLIISILNISNKLNTFASENINDNYRKITDVAVLVFTFDSLYMKQFTNNLISLQNQHKDKIRFTFYDLKNNISTQNVALDTILKGNSDLIVALLPDTTEDTVKDIMSKAKTKNIPIIFVDIEPQIVQNVSHYYNKAAFILEDSYAIGTMQGKMIADQWNANKKVMDKNGDGILQYVLIKAINLPAISDVRARSSILSINNEMIGTEELQLINVNWAKEIAKTGIENAFLKHNGNIEAIISISDNMAIGAIEGLQKYGYNTGNKLKYIPVFGINGVPEAKDLIDRGLMAGTIVLEPNQAAEAVYAIGMNLIKNLNPIENTNYKLVNGEIMHYETPTVYIKKINATPSPQSQ